MDWLDDSDPAAPDYDFVYDRLDRVIQTNWTSGGASYSTSNIFDTDRRNTFQLKANGVSQIVDDYFYDNLSRVQYLNRNQGTNSYYAEFGYNKAGQTTNVKRYGSSLMAESRYAYDKAGWLDKLEQFNPAGVKVDGWDYTFDPAARLKSIVAHNAAENVTYTYDKAGQLKTADYSTLTDESYNYDNTGNRNLKNGITSLYTVNRLTDDGTFTYGYDDEGNQLTKVRKSTAQANDKTVEYAWDQRDRLATATFKRNDGVITKKVTYTYDAFDRLTKRVLDPDGNLGSATLVTEEFFYDGDELVHSRSSVASESHYYLIDPNSGDVLFDQKASTVYATLTDHLGTIRDLVNTSGQVVNHLVYDAFGNRRTETNPQGGAVPFSPQMGFTGQWLDSATGLQYNHHRWYDASTGRWLSEDPIGFEAGDGNLYRYVTNQPTTHIDPTGLWGFWDWYYGNGFWNDRGTRLSEQVAEAQQNKALGGNCFDFARDFRRIQFSGSDVAAQDIQALAEFGIEFNAAALGGGFIRPGITIRNSHLAGQRHPVTGIPFDKKGFPDFSGVAKNTVKIKQTGNRAIDEIAANRAAGLKCTPEGYTWHHHQDGKTMQLVPTDIHRKTGHTGGVGLRK